MTIRQLNEGRKIQKRADLVQILQAFLGTLRKCQDPLFSDPGIDSTVTFIDYK